MCVPYSLWYDAYLPYAGVLPQGVTHRQHIATRHLTHHLVSPGKVKHVERVGVGAWLAERGGREDVCDAVVKDLPVTVLGRREG